MARGSTSAVFRSTAQIRPASFAPLRLVAATLRIALAAGRATACQYQGKNTVAGAEQDDKSDRPRQDLIDQLVKQGAKLFIIARRPAACGRRFFNPPETGIRRAAGAIRR